MEKWYVYIIRCKDGSFYTGIISDLKRRFQEHAELKGGRYTKLFKANNIEYFEIYYSKNEALKRERQIKGWRREKKINLIKFGVPKSPAV